MCRHSNASNLRFQQSPYTPKSMCTVRKSNPFSPSLTEKRNTSPVTRYFKKQFLPGAWRSWSTITHSLLLMGTCFKQAFSSCGSLVEGRLSFELPLYYHLASFNKLLIKTEGSLCLLWRQEIHVGLPDIINGFPVTVPNWLKHWRSSSSLIGSLSPKK